MDNNNPNNNSGVDGADNRFEVLRGGMMDPTTERILISVGSIGMLAIVRVLRRPTTNSANRWLHSPVLHCLDGLAVDEEVKEQGQCQQRLWRISNTHCLQDPFPQAKGLAKLG